MSLRRPLLITATLLLGLGGPAHAQSLTSNVGSANVTEGERGIEARIGVNGNGDAASRAHYEQAFTDWYKLRLIASASGPDGGSWDFSGVTVENWFQWREEASNGQGFNGGLRLAYGIADDGPDEIAARLTLTDRFGEGWEWRANLIGDVEIGNGSGDGVTVEARGQVSKAVPLRLLATEEWRVGAEVFSEFGNLDDLPGLGDQAHQVGPVVKAGWPNGVYLLSAVRVGLTDGADDAMWKLSVGRKF